MQSCSLALFLLSSLVLPFHTHSRVSGKEVLRTKQLSFVVGGRVGARVVGSGVGRGVSSTTVQTFSQSL